MSDRDHVMALLAEGNPATEHGEHAWSHLDAAAYLATLHERSSEMVQLKTRNPVTVNRGARWAPVLVGALLIVILGTALVLISQGTEDSPVVTAPSTTAAQPTTTTAVESPLADVPTWLGQEEPGTYQPSLFSFPLAFTLADGGWERGVDRADQFAICGPDVEGPIGARSACFRAAAVAVFVLGRGTVEETQAYLGTFPGAEVTGVEPLSIDGAEGVRFSFSHGLAPRSSMEGGYDGYPYWVHEAQEIPLGADRSIVSIVDVAGTTVTVVYQGRTTFEPTAFDTNLDEGMAIIDSIVWDN